MGIFKASLLCIALIVLGLGVGCGRMEPTPYHPVSEVPQGPGLITGQKGAIVMGGDRSTDSPAAPQAKTASPGPRASNSPQQ